MDQSNERISIHKYYHLFEFFGDHLVKRVPCYECAKNLQDATLELHSKHLYHHCGNIPFTYVLLDVYFYFGGEVFT